LSACELFETFDSDNRPLGLIPRHEVHRRGLWHRASNVFLFDSRGALYLQRRAATKDVWPNAWDLSVGEHLQPGESFEQAAHRGLAEELSVYGVALTPLGDVVRGCVEIPELHIRDCELQQSFRGVYDGDVVADPVASLATAMQPSVQSSHASWAMIGSLGNPWIITMPPGGAPERCA
jgi:hypothetical protein